jgi:hypothetical protein
MSAVGVYPTIEGLIVPAMGVCPTMEGLIVSAVGTPPLLWVVSSRRFVWKSFFSSWCFV